MVNFRLYKTLLRLIETLKGLHILTFAIKYLHLKSTLKKRFLFPNYSIHSNTLIKRNIYQNQRDRGTADVGIY